MHSLIRLFLIINCAFFFATASAQNQQKADSLFEILSTQQLDTIDRLEVLFWLSTYSSSPNTELQYGQDLLSLAQASQSQEYIIKAYQRIGVAHRLKGNLSDAFEYLFKSANEALGIPEYELMLADTYTEISTCYTLNQDSENALKYGQRTVEILRKSDQIQRLALNLLNLGYDYYLINQYDQALSHYNESETYLQELSMDIGLAYIKGNRALVYWKQGQLQRAKSDLLEAIEMLRQLGDYYAIADYYNQLSSIYLEESNIPQAREYVNIALQLAKENGLKEQIRDAYQILYTLSNMIEDYKQGIAYQTYYHSFKDSIQNQETADLLANLRTEFEIERKQAEVNLLLEQKRNNQIIIATGSIILIAVIVIAILIYRYSTQKSRLNKQLNEQKDNLVTLNDTKDKFFSIISHDLRGPVGVLNGLIFAIKKDLEYLDTSELKDMLGHMDHSANHLVKLLDNLLHWALQQKGHFPYEPRSNKPE